MAKMPWREYVKACDALNARGERVRRMIVARARRVALASGLDPTMPFLHAHNAKVSADAGQPWREVDMAGCREVLHLEQRSYEPGRLVHAVLSRLFRQTL